MHNKILADESIPFVHELFSPLGEITLVPGRLLSREDIQDNNILLVRSVTQVNEALLNSSSIEFVGTCTIGVDHLDTRYLDSQGIHYSSAPGCNANAVVQYVVAVLAHLHRLENNSGRAVIVGAGNVGSRIYKALSVLGYRCAAYDPFLTQAQADQKGLQLVAFSEVYEADVVCVHTPFTLDGTYPTGNMFGYEQLNKLKPGALFINAGRGGVVNNDALKRVIKIRPDLQCVLDVWAHEPAIDLELLALVTLGTPHIAGYSFDGRVTGSLMIFDALCHYLNIDAKKGQEIRDQVCSEGFGEAVITPYQSLSQAILDTYDIERDYQNLIAKQAEIPAGFDWLRKHYPKRREFSHFCLRDVAPAEQSVLRGLGFAIDG